MGWSIKLANLNSIRALRFKNNGSNSLKPLLPIHGPELECPYSAGVYQIGDVYARSCPMVVARPAEGEPGSGMHFHIFMTDKQKRIFFDKEGYCSLSKPALNAIAGILYHAPAVCAFSNASVNSYHRLVPGQEAPVFRFFSGPNRSAAIRIPSYARTAESMRFEYRVPDGISNPYLSMSAILMAAIDGMKKDMDPEILGYGPIDENVFAEDYDTSNLHMLPRNLGEALDALEADRDFLEDGNVFSTEMIDDYIKIKRDEIDSFKGSPHPKEHSLYFSM